MNGRILSVDALRGFDMFWILGGAALVVQLARLCGADDASWIVRQMSHVPWEGFHHHDTIFPLFLFLAGVSWPFSLAGQRRKGRSNLRICGKIALRACSLILLGMALGGGLLDFRPNFRIPSVLGYIGASWAIAAVVFMSVKEKVRVWMAPLVLVLYEILLVSCGTGPDRFAAETNVIGRLDGFLMPSHILAAWGDPESFFAVPGGVALALLGMGAGALLQRADIGGGAKVLRLLAAGVGALAGACVFVFVLKTPIVKSLWTPSFVLAAAAWSFASLALFYWVIDVLGFRRWTIVFTVVGMNSILAYALMMIGAVNPFKSALFRGVGNAVPAAAAPTVNALAVLVTYWLLLYFLYRKNVFLKL